MPNLRQRHRQPEVMDQPGLDAHAHGAALSALVRINWWSGSAGILWPALHALARTKSSRPVRILDVASGAGDVPIRLWQRAQRAGVPLVIDGCDVSPTACDYARRRAASAGVDVRFLALDVLREPLPDDYDVLTSSLFLHHLDEDEAIQVLRAMGQAARQMVLVNDLLRSQTGYLLAWSGTRILSRSWVAHIDGPRSVEGAFTCSEALVLAEQAGLRGTTVAQRWPCRFLLSWRRPT
jgi:2-polyprenyl-3-methyl-5-hydroxy-6-metoxy-1,4-benzoquinol methylase